MLQQISSFFRSDLPIAFLGTIFGTIIGASAEVNSAKWAAISAIGTVLVAKFFQYASKSKTSAVQVATIAAERERELLRTFTNIVQAKTDEKHNTAGVLNELLLTIYGLKTGAIDIGSIDVNRLIQKGQEATKPIVPDGRKDGD